MNRPPDDHSVHVRNGMIGDTPQRHARETLVHQIAQSSRNANNVSPVYVDYFQKLKVGRRCSCWDFDDSPQGQCRICYGTGTVGGYSKRGAKTEVFDVTFPRTRAVNVAVDYSRATRPKIWTLVDTAVAGYLQWEIPIRTNVGRVDLLQILDVVPEGASISYEVKQPSEMTWVEMTIPNVEARLGFERLQFRAVLSRKNPSIQLPKIVSVRMAYRLMDVTALRANIPRTEESLVLEEFGIYESFTSQSFFFDNELRVATPEDFIVNVTDGTRWKITSVQDNRPFGVLTSWDLVARVVKGMEVYGSIPVGISDTEFLPPEFVRSIETDLELIEHHRIMSGNISVKASDPKVHTTDGRVNDTINIREMLIGKD